MKLIKGLLSCSISSVIICILQSNILSMNLKISKPLYPLTIPNPDQQPFIYFFIFSVQLSSSFHLTMVNMATLCIFAYISNFVCVQITLLGDSFKVLMTKKYNINKTEKYHKFHENIRYHFHLLRLVLVKNLLEKIFLVCKNK